MAESAESTKTITGSVPLGRQRQTSAAPAGGNGSTADPLARPYRLPSGGVYYPDGHDGTVLIAPTRGEQEEIIAGASDSPQGQLAVLRHVTSQCIDTKGLPFNDLLLNDWTAAMLHFLAMSAGTDVVGLRPVHPGCGKASNQSRPLTAMPCVTLRLAEPGEEPTWPPAAVDSDLEALREMDDEAAEGVVHEHVMSAADLAEPFTVKLPTGQTVQWRHLRLSDLIRAEEFAARTGDAQTTPGSKMHTFILARHLVTVEGKAMTGLESVTWVRRQPTPVLNALRADLARREFGYDVTPRFRCPHCGGSFKVRLPLDGSLFRSGAHS